MARSIEMNYKMESGDYEVLYPMVLVDNVEGLNDSLGGYLNVKGIDGWTLIGNISGQNYSSTDVTNNSIKNNHLNVPICAFRIKGTIQVTDLTSLNFFSNSCQILSGAINTSSMGQINIDTIIWVNSKINLLPSSHFTRSTEIPIEGTNFTFQYYDSELDNDEQTFYIDFGPTFRGSRISLDLSLYYI